MKNVKLSHRRQFLHLAAGVAALPVLSRLARAQSYPSRPIRIIVGYAAGGPNDIVARLIGQGLSEHVGQPVIIENRPGAASNTATEVVVNAAPDGYTILLVNASNAINATLYEKLNFNFIRDIVPVASIMRVPNVMVVNPSFPAKSVPEFIAYAKNNPGKINFGSGGIGTSIHVSSELFRMMAGIDMTHVPYRGEAPALSDLLGGQIQVVFGTTPASIEHLRAGKLRALALTAATRSEVLPEVPTINEFLPGYEASSWYGLGVPKNTAVQVVEKLNHEINASLVDQTMKTRASDMGGTVLVGSPADFSKLIADETEKWATVVKFANLKPE